MTYLLWLALFIGLPLLALWRWQGTLVARRWQALAWTLLGALLFGWWWDGLAIQIGIWFYAPDKISGLWLGGMPLEEWLWIGGVVLLFGSLTIVLKERADATTPSTHAIHPPETRDG